MGTSIKRKPPSKSIATATPEPDLRAALELAMQLMAIEGTSGHECQVRDFIVRKLTEAGLPRSALRTDNAHRQTPIEGETGNLIARFPGTLRGPRRLLMAHMDTVPLCVGSQPVLKGGVVRSADRHTGLGADDRAGCAVVLAAALEILRHNLPHGPLVFFWPVQEEIGLYGAHFANLRLLGAPKLAFNWDGGSASKMGVGATGAYRITIDVRGLASHAGVAPERGVSAIAIAGLAIAELEGGGWLGDVRQGDRRGTANIGIVRGGNATNVVTDHVHLRAEARSHDARFRKQMLRAIHDAFRNAARAIKNVDGVTGKIEFASRLDYEAFHLDADEPCVVAAEAAIRSTGAESLRAVSNGGLDANWMTAHGIPTVTLGCGQQNVHTTNETLNVAEFERACRVALRLATGTETNE
ncbi:MAG TPA: M20/M25/M40 family metallo-hydrolase [Pirellulales bacterium]|jgi:tripeptide aminopeptidase|nr:M20/M25/M40 family metallo-hydrolase [Pirellulales bacterium]